MNKSIKFYLFFFCLVVALSSCATKKEVNMSTFVPEEHSLNLVKIIDEGNSVLAHSPSNYKESSFSSDYTRLNRGVSKHNGVLFIWPTNKLLDISADGEKLAYLSDVNGQQSVMVRSTKSGGVATQRTFRKVSSFSFGSDGRIYFSDYSGVDNMVICSVDAEAGSLMTQHTSGSVSDLNPCYSADGNKIFFERHNYDEGGPYIWSLTSDGKLTMCARGFNPCIIRDNSDAFYCVRNSSEGRSEIWYIDFVKGIETLVLSDQNRSFTNPCLSPDGEWIVCNGNSQSSISKEQNRDIFAVRVDGTQLIQLTYHPAEDMCPVWSADGRSIYFVSSRANKDDKFSVWRMNFDL